MDTITFINAPDTETEKEWRAWHGIFCGNLERLERERLTLRPTVKEWRKAIDLLTNDNPRAIDSLHSVY